MEKNKFCTNCGEPSSKGMFCRNCGKKMLINIEDDKINEADTPKTNKIEVEDLKQPVHFQKSISRNKDFDHIANNTESPKKELRSGSKGWIIFGFISAVLGGMVGIAMGAHYAWWGKNYDESTRTSGYIMMVIGAICFVIFKNV